MKFLFPLSLCPGVWGAYLILISTGLILFETAEVEILLETKSYLIWNYWSLLHTLPPSSSKAFCAIKCKYWGLWRYLESTSRPSRVLLLNFRVPVSIIQTLSWLSTKKKMNSGKDNPKQKKIIKTFLRFYFGMLCMAFGEFRFSYPDTFCSGKKMLKWVCIP